MYLFLLFIAHDIAHTLASIAKLSLCLRLFQPIGRMYSDDKNQVKRLTFFFSV